MDREFSDLTGYSSLPLGRRARLYLRLCQARSRYDIRRVIQAAPAPTAAAREVKEISKSISRVSAFARRALGDSPDPAARAAFHGLGTVAEQWARAQNRHALPHGFEPTMFEGKDHDGVPYRGTDYGSYGYLIQFFESARFVEKFAKEAEIRLRGSPKTKLSETAIEWLAGRELPELYTYTFKLPFARTVETATSKTSDGIIFVIAALKFLQIRSSQGGPFSPATIRTHAQKVARLSRR
jgi:hypothetical protein